jgi:curved DNA-binding protein CbpA
MQEESTTDYYEVLQVSSNADPETIHRVYRLLAQRFHPDNRETGDADRFLALTEAYGILSEPEKRARYDVVHERQRQERWRLVSTGAPAENEFEMEQAARLTVLEVLYTKRRLEPSSPGIHLLELEELIGRPREHLQFTIWFLAQKKFLERDDASRLVLTADGAEHLEQHYRTVVQQQKRLRVSNTSG